MLKSSVNVDIRNDIGSNASNRIRNSGHIPGVLYGYNTEPRNIELDRKEFNSILRSYGTSVLLDLEINGQVMTSMIKEIQRDPVKNDILHVDFQTVSYNKPIHVTVPVKLIDKEFAQDSQATIQHQLRELNIECLPQNIPQNIEISVKNLVFGQPITIGDIEFAEEISVLHDPDEVIASLTHGEKVVDDEGEEESLLDRLTDI